MIISFCSDSIPTNQRSTNFCRKITDIDKFFNFKLLDKENKTPYDYVRCSFTIISYAVTCTIVLMPAAVLFHLYIFLLAVLLLFCIGILFFLFCIFVSSLRKQMHPNTNVINL